MPMLMFDVSGLHRMGSFSRSGFVTPTCSNKAVLPVQGIWRCNVWVNVGELVSLLNNTPKTFKPNRNIYFFCLIDYKPRLATITSSSSERVSASMRPHTGAARVSWTSASCCAAISLSHCSHWPHSRQDTRTSALATSKSFVHRTTCSYLSRMLSFGGLLWCWVTMLWSTARQGRRSRLIVWATAQM